MFEELTRDAETEEVLDDLRDYRVPPEWFEYRTAAFEHMETKGGVRIAPVGYVRDDHRDVIAEIANELLRIEGRRSASPSRSRSAAPRSPCARTASCSGEDRERIVHIIDHLLEYAFPGASGFKHERRPPHRVEGGAFVPHSQSQQRLWGLGGRGTSPDGDPILEHCRACARAIVAALEGHQVRAPGRDPGTALESDP
jgi:hypothetical protein